VRQGGHLFLLGLGRELEDSEHYFPEKEEERGRITRKAKLHSQLGSDLGRILLIGINQVRAEGTVGLASLENLLGFISRLGGPCAHCSSLLSGSPVVEGGFHFGVDLPF